MADSRGLLGAKPLEVICAALAALPQSSLVAMTDWSDERTSCSVGLGSAPLTPKLASDGPMARTTTVLAIAPLMTKPPIITSKPVCTWPRVEMLARRGGLGVKVAVTPTSAFSVAMQVPVPEHPPPDHPMKVDADAAAESVTTVPELKFATHVDPQAIPAGDDVTVPEPKPALVTVSAKLPTGVRLKVAVTEVAALMVTVQPPVPLQPPPDHPAKKDPEVAAAESITTVPELKLATHVDPQEMLPGDDVTVPAPVPFLPTVSAKVPAGATLKVAVTAVAAFMVTLQPTVPLPPPPNQPPHLQP